MILTVILIVLLMFIIGLVFGRWQGRKLAKAYPPQGQFMMINGVKVHYLDLGCDESDLPPVVLIHGVSSSACDMQLALGTALAPSRRVIILDRPGYGYSERPAQASALATQSALIAGLIEGLKLHKPIVVGHSFGGAVALNFALLHSDKLCGLLLLAPPSHRWPGGVAGYNHLALRPVLGWFFLHLVVPLYGLLVGEKVVAKAFWPLPPPEGFYEKAQMALIFRPAAMRASAADIVALYDQVVVMEPCYEQIQVPLRMVAGTHDTAVLSTIHCMSLERQIAGARLRYVPGIGHPLHHGARAEICEELALLDQQVAEA